MAVQRNLWNSSHQVWPAWPCPSCRVGTVRIVKNSIIKEETSESKADQKHEAWDPDWIKKRFSATFACTNSSCKDTVFVCGRITTDWWHYYDEDGEPHRDLDETYIPSFFEPALPVFPIPTECPEEVEKELRKAFSLIWSDIGSSGNRLRVAVETLLNERKIQKKARIKKGKNKGKFHQLTLHERIKLFEEKRRDAATQLMAIKWLGNTGSHAVQDVLTRDDLHDAFEHFEYALDLIYVKKDVALAKRAKRIIKRKGPIKAKPRRKRR